MVVKSLEAAPIEEVTAATWGASIASEKDPIIIEEDSDGGADVNYIIVVSGRQWKRLRGSHSLLRKLGLFRIGRLNRSERGWILA